MNMRKLAYFAAILLVAVMFAGCGKKDQTQQQAQGGGDEVQMEEFSATIEEMAKKGKPYACEYSLTAEGVAQQGTIYLAGENKIRGDIKVNIPQTGESVTHFIKDGDTQYIWSDGQETGIKMTMTKEEEERYKAQADESGQQSVDMDTKVNLKCRKWSVDGGAFNPPSGIKFQDFDEMMKSLENMTGAVSGSAGASAGSAGISVEAEDINMCEICNQIPAGAARDSCKKQNCN